MAALIPSDIRRYLDGLLFLAGQQLGQADYKVVLHDLFARLNRFTMLAYLNSLSASSRAVVEQMVAQQRPADEVEHVIHDHVPDMPQVHVDALRAFRRAYLHEIVRGRRNAQAAENSW